MKRVLTHHVKNRDTLPHISLSRESLGEHEEYSLCIENSSSQSIELSLGIISQESPRDRINAVNSMDDIDAMGKVVKLGVPHLTLGPRFFEEEEEEEEREVDMEETKGHVKRVPLDNASPGIKVERPLFLFQFNDLITVLG
jgi:hypothetical protein